MVAVETIQPSLEVTIHQSIDSFLLLLANQVLAVSRTLANTKSIAAPVTGTQSQERRGAAEQHLLITE